MDQCEWVNFIIQNHFKWITGVLGILVIETDSTNRISAFSFIHRVIAYIMKIKLKYINMRVSIRWDELQMGLD